jgi:hypothetical protein
VTKNRGAPVLTVSDRAIDPLVELLLAAGCNVYVTDRDERIMSDEVASAMAQVPVPLPADTGYAHSGPRVYRVLR